MIGQFLRARAHLRVGERAEAVDLLDEARARARRLEHVWLELHAHAVARAGGLTDFEDASASLDRMFRERNPEDPERAAAYLERSWATVDPA